jgi:hypothetical protein
MSTALVVAQGRAMSRTPLKPMRMPRRRSGVTCSLRSRMAALRNENSGMAPLSAPATPEASSEVPAAKAK